LTNERREGWDRFGRTKIDRFGWLRRCAVLCLCVCVCVWGAGLSPCACKRHPSCDPCVEYAPFSLYRLVHMSMCVDDTAACCHSAVELPALHQTSQRVCWTQQLHIRFDTIMRDYGQGGWRGYKQDFSTAAINCTTLVRVGHAST
jgi:hypothetical protein